MKVTIVYQHCNVWKGSSEERIVCASPLEAQKVIRKNKKYEFYFAGNDFAYKRVNIFVSSESVFYDVSKQQRPHARSKKEWEITQEAAREKTYCQKNETYPWGIFDEDDSNFDPYDGFDDENIII